LEYVSQKVVRGICRTHCCVSSAKWSRERAKILRYNYIRMLPIFFGLACEVEHFPLHVCTQYSMQVNNYKHGDVGEL